MTTGSAPLGGYDDLMQRDSNTPPLAAALDGVGEKWTLLVVNALASGPRRFGELQEDIEGVATNTLSDRLRRLEREGVLVATPYSKRPLRMTYQLTGAGRDLAAALSLLAGWGERREGDADSLRHSVCGTPMTPRWYCPTCEQPVDESDSDGPRFV